MIELKRHIQVDATPEEIFEAMSDPDGLKAIMPRVQKVEMLSQTPERAQLVTHMAMPGLGTMRTEGELEWQEPHRITYRARRPVLVESIWEMAPAAGGTRLSAHMKLDLAPMIGPLAAFVPTDMVSGMIAQDLDNALREIARRAQPVLRERAAAA